jgi:predicted nucleic acid-binding protein
LIDPNQLHNTRILVDTDVFSFIFRKDSRADFFKPYLLNKILALSFMSVAELYYGAYKDNWGPARIGQLENQIKRYVVLPYDYLICQQWAIVKRQKELKGLGMSHSDLWIAASALRHDCPLTTYNAQHFKQVEGLTIISPTFI